MTQPEWVRNWVRTDPVDDTVTVTAHGRTFRMEAQPGKITKTIRRTGRPYEAPLLEHIWECGFTGTAVDAGANFGNHTLWLAAICGLHVVAAEPIQHRVLTRNVAMNGLDDRQVLVLPVALGREHGVAAHVAKGTLDPAGDGDIVVVPLDSLRLDDVSVIKADVEDMEPDVFAGGAETIRRCRPVIFAETHDGQHEKIAAVLEPWGYRPGLTLNAAESLTPVTRWDP